MKKAIIYLSLSIIFLSACKKSFDQPFKKDVVYKNLPTFMSLCSFFNDQKAGGKFMITANAPLNYHHKQDFTVNINGAFVDKSTQFKIAGGENTFNNFPISPNPDLSYYKDFTWDEGKSFFGQKMNLILNKTIGYSAAGQDNNYITGYIPEVIVNENELAIPQTTFDGKYLSGSTLYPGFKIKWNKDSLNRNGVFIYMEYLPNDAGNEDLKVVNPERAANAIIIDDTGEYTITSSLFEDIPLNAKITFYLGRGNFEYATDTNGTVSDLQISAFSYQWGDFFYKTP